MKNPIKVHSFNFSTKAQNLRQLKERLTVSKICDLEVIPVYIWQENKDSCLGLIKGRFRDQEIIIRSSAPCEDSLESSYAGAFESMAYVNSNNDHDIKKAVETVIDSYRTKDAENFFNYELLIQPMVNNVVISGVLFTRDLEKKGPYYVLNYDDESSRTDTVTAGLNSSNKVLRIFRGSDFIFDPKIHKIIKAAQEIETVVGCDALDIEFAINSDDELYILQVRPLTQTRILSFQSLDRKIASEIGEVKKFVKGKLARKPGLYGDTSIFGEMPDWNPAEIIGTQPKPLSLSLYAYIIMRSIWRESRALMGYKDAFPYQLMVVLGGRPYVDVRNSFNSFLPQGLPDQLANKLVNYYLKQLELHPEFHDKIEFEIAITCLTFDFSEQSKKLKAAGFDDDEISTIKKALFDLTDNIINDSNNLLNNLERQVENLKHRREDTLREDNNINNIPMLVEVLLEECIKFGTLPFSVFARCAFIGTSFLRSLVSQKVISKAEYDNYIHSIDTIASSFLEDLELCKKGEEKIDRFLEKYGHLRPGTYDICTYTYAERPDLYLSVGDHSSIKLKQRCDDDEKVKSTVKSIDLQLPQEAHEKIQKLIDIYGFTFNIEELNRFIIRSIQLRERIKFEFTKKLSKALTLMANFGSFHGFSREDLSYISIENFLYLANHSSSEHYISMIREIIERNRKYYELTCSINMPDLIFSESDIEFISLQKRRPNFVTQKKVIAPLFRIKQMGDIICDLDLEGKIVLIENADPGFDWLFSKKIAGLVTKYGGAASHMTIRCAEFGLPAAIGCGEQIFSQLENVKSVKLDCAEQKVEPDGL